MFSRKISFGFHQFPSIEYTALETITIASLIRISFIARQFPKQMINVFFLPCHYWYWFDIFVSDLMAIISISCSNQDHHQIVQWKLKQKSKVNTMTGFYLRLCVVLSTGTFMNPLLKLWHLFNVKDHVSILCCVWSFGSRFIWFHS